MIWPPYYTQLQSNYNQRTMIVPEYYNLVEFNEEIEAKKKRNSLTLLAATAAIVVGIVLANKYL